MSWRLEGFDKDDESLKHEAKLPGQSEEIIHFLRTVLDLRDDDPDAIMFYEISGDRLSRVASRFGVSVDRRLDYFVGVRSDL